MTRFAIPVLRVVVFAALCVGLAGSAFAQKSSNVGRAKCVNCHDHDREKLWSEKKDGPPPNNHLNALKQMDSPKSAGFAKAVGVADPYDPGSSCVKCHATIVKGDVGGGITCESCHGPGSGYLDPHQKKDAYPAAVAAGMTDAVKKPQAWAPLCMNCHVMDDSRLIAAKHPSGDDFDLGAKFGVVATDHWKNQYEKGQISGLGKAELAKIQGKRKGAPAVTTAAPAPAPAAPAAPAAPPAAAPAPAAPPAAAPAPAAAPPGSHAACGRAADGGRACRCAPHAPSGTARAARSASDTCGSCAGSATGARGADTRARPAGRAAADTTAAAGRDADRHDVVARRAAADLTRGRRRRRAGPRNRAHRLAAAPRRPRPGARDAAREEVEL